MGACVADSGGYISRLSRVRGEAMLQSNDLCKRAPLPQCVLCLVTQSCPPGSSAHGDSPGKNTGVGCHALLQGIFPIQGLNPGLLHCRQILSHLSHQGSPTSQFSQAQFRDASINTQFSNKQVTASVQ